MKPYSSQNHLTAKGLILLGIGSIPLGLICGVLAYFISNFIYFVVVFPLVIGGATTFIYSKLLQMTKVRHSIISAVFGIVTGLSVAVAFYGTPYLALRSKIIANYQEKYHMDAIRASTAFDSVLIQETGSSGFIGYMKLRASEGDEYTNYLIVNSMPIQLFSFSLKSTGAWLYWLLEIILFTFPVAWLGYGVGKRLFNKSANDWYNLYSSQIGSVRLEDKERLLAYFQTNDFSGISHLIVPEGEIKHPVLEIYKQRSNNKKGDILLSVKQTYRKNQSSVKRTLLNQWEIPQIEFESIEKMLDNKFTENTLTQSAG
jgi:hypothetical protein